MNTIKWLVNERTRSFRGRVSNLVSFFLHCFGFPPQLFIPITFLNLKFFFGKKKSTHTIPFTLAGAGHLGPSLSSHFTTPLSPGRSRPFRSVSVLPPNHSLTLAGAGHLGPSLSSQFTFPLPLGRSRPFRSVSVLPPNHSLYPGRGRPFRSVSVIPLHPPPFSLGRGRPFWSVSVLPPNHSLYPGRGPAI